MLGLRKRSRADIPTPAAGTVYLTFDTDGLLVFKKEDGSVVAPETLIAELTEAVEGGLGGGGISEAELNAAVASLTTAIAAKQDASTAATDTELASETTARTNADALLLPKAGGTMTGLVTLSGDPTNSLHAATKQWVAAQITALINGAPGALDTLNEIAEKLGSDESAVAALTSTVAGKLGASANLSDLANAVTARANLGLGSAATQASSAFDTAGAAATEKARAETAEATKASKTELGTETTAREAADSTEKGRAEAAEALKLAKASNLSDVASAATARTNLGLGTAATAASTAFDAAGAATTEETRAKAAESTERTRAETAEALKLAKASNLSDLASAATARTNLGLGSAALLEASTAPVIRGVEGEPTVLETDQAGDLALDIGKGVLYGPLTGTPEVGQKWNHGTSSALIRYLPVDSRRYRRPEGYLAESLIREFILQDQVTMASGTLVMSQVELNKGDIVKKLVAVTGGTGATTPTHSWMGLYNASREQLAVTADAGTGAIGTYERVEKAIATIAAGAASSYTVPATGRYYVGLCVVAATAPKLYGSSSNPATNVAPGLGGPSSTGLTGPPGFPTTATAPTFVGSGFAYFGVIGE